NEGLEHQWFSKSHDDSSWDKQNVPGSWDLYDTEDFGSYDGSNYGEGSAFYDGYAWYRTSFKAHAKWKDQFIKLNFLGVNYRAWVYINGDEVAVHEGGHTPFSIDISEYVEPGKDNVIAVRVYRRPWYDT